jgi:hypothetical protein
LLALAVCARAAIPIPFHTTQPGFVSVAIYGADGSLTRQVLAGAELPPGDHSIPWDDTGLPPGQYTWRAIFHEDLPLKVRGWIGDFGGDLGPPSAATADDSKVYLGWSLSSADGDTIVACDPAGAIRWTHRRGPLSGCRALAVDGGTLFVLGGKGADADGCALYRLNTADGAPVPWPDGRIDLEIASLWPAKANYKPDRAQYLGVKNGRIYLSFTAGQFISVLDAKSGKYLQTIVGAPPGAIDATPTLSDTPDNPGVNMEADFVVTSLNGSSIGKLLLAHNPIWVLASDITQLTEDKHIAALTIIGDGAKHHGHDIFTAFGPPLNQVQCSSALATETVSYVAGKPGGRDPGLWQSGRMADIRGIALDSASDLWVAEGDPIPGRVSVWNTDLARGRLIGEFFSPPVPGSPVAVYPQDPTLIFAGGCEWRVDPASGRASCLGIVSRALYHAARYAVTNGHLLLVLTPPSGPNVVLQRNGDGDYKPYPGPVPEPTPAKFTLLPTPSGHWHLATADGCDLGPLSSPTLPPIAAGMTFLPTTPPILTQTAGGQLYLTAASGRLWNLQVEGADTIRPLASGTFALTQSSK